MKTLLPTAGALLCVIALGSSKISAQTLSAVVGSGAVSSAQGGARLSATVGQTGIGFTAAASTEAALGFWHQQSSKTAAYQQDEEATSSTRLALAGTPNPFVHSTTLSFSLPRTGSVSLLLYDAAGRHITTLIDEELIAGEISREIDLNEMPAGHYMAVLRIDDRIAWTSLILAD